MTTGGKTDGAKREDSASGESTEVELSETIHSLNQRRLSFHGSYVVCSGSEKLRSRFRTGKNIYIASTKTGNVFDPRRTGTLAVMNDRYLVSFMSNTLHAKRIKSLNDDKITFYDDFSYNSRATRSTLLKDARLLQWDSQSSNVLLIFFEGQRQRHHCRWDINRNTISKVNVPESEELTLFRKPMSNDGECCLQHSQIGYKLFPSLLDDDEGGGLFLGTAMSSLQLIRACNNGNRLSLKLMPGTEFLRGQNSTYSAEIDCSNEIVGRVIAVYLQNKRMIVIAGVHVYVYFLPIDNSMGPQSQSNFSHSVQVASEDKIIHSTTNFHRTTEIRLVICDKETGAGKTIYTISTKDVLDPSRQSLEATPKAKDPQGGGDKAPCVPSADRSPNSPTKPDPPTGKSNRTAGEESAGAVDDLLRSSCGKNGGTGEEVSNDQNQSLAEILNDVSTDKNEGKLERRSLFGGGSSSSSTELLDGDPDGQDNTNVAFPRVVPSISPQKDPTLPSNDKTQLDDDDEEEVEKGAEETKQYVEVDETDVARGKEPEGVKTPYVSSPPASGSTNSQKRPDPPTKEEKTTPSSDSVGAGVDSKQELDSNSPSFEYRLFSSPSAVPNVDSGGNNADIGGSIELVDDSENVSLGLGVEPADSAVSPPAVGSTGRDCIAADDDDYNVDTTVLYYGHVPPEGDNDEDRNHLSDFAGSPPQPQEGEAVGSGEDVAAGSTKTQEAEVDQRQGFVVDKVELSPASTPSKGADYYGDEDGESDPSIDEGYIPDSGAITKEERSEKERKRRRYIDAEEGNVPEEHMTAEEGEATDASQVGLDDVVKSLAKSLSSRDENSIEMKNPPKAQPSDERLKDMIDDGYLPSAVEGEGTEEERSEGEGANITKENISSKARSEPSHSSQKEEALASVLVATATVLQQGGSEAGDIAQRASLPMKDAGNDTESYSSEGVMSEERSAKEKEAPSEEITPAMKSPSTSNLPVVPPPVENAVELLKDDTVTNSNKSSDGDIEAEQETENGNEAIDAERAVMPPEEAEATISENLPDDEEREDADEAAELHEVGTFVRSEEEVVETVHEEGKEMEDVAVLPEERTADISTNLPESEHEEEMEAEEDDDSIGSLTVIKLKEQCRERGLKVGGKKVEIVQRIKDYDAAVPENPVETASTAKSEPQKKRGRGRPRKQTAGPSSKSSSTRRSARAKKPASKGATY